jgi:hypothetical protein
MKVIPVEKRCLSVQELANYLGVSKTFIHTEYPEWCTKFGIKVYRIGTNRGKLLFEKSDIDQKLLPNFLMK